MSSMIYQTDADGRIKDSEDNEPLNVNVQFGNKLVAIVSSGDKENFDDEGYTSLVFSSNGEKIPI